MAGQGVVTVVDGPRTRYAVSSTGAAAHPEEIDEAPPDQARAPIHARTVSPPPTECQRPVTQVTHLSYRVTRFYSPPSTSISPLSQIAQITRPRQPSVRGQRPRLAWERLLHPAGGADRPFQRLRGNHALPAALTGIAAVVGVIANLAIYLAAHALFAVTRPHNWGPVHVQLPDPTTIRPAAVAVTALAMLPLFRLRWSVLRTLGICAPVGITAASPGSPRSPIQVTTRKAGRHNAFHAPALSCLLTEPDMGFRFQP
jgi:hypothetical protein